MMYSAFFQRISIIILLCLSSFRAEAQEYLYEIGGMLGGSFYMGDTNKDTPFRNMNPAVSAIFRYNANFRVAFKADLAWARLSGTTEGIDNVFPNNAQTSFERNVIDLGGQAEFNFFPYSDKYKYLYTKRIAPYIAAGLGFAVATGGGGDTSFSPYLSIGTGMKYKIKHRINVGAEFSVRKLFGDGLEGKDMLNDPYGIGSGMFKNKDWYSVLMISVSYDFGLRNCNCNRSDMIGIY